MLVRDMMVTDFIGSRKEAAIKECITQMFEKHVGSVVVIEDERCAGIFTERDVIRVNAQDIPLDAPIEKAMTKNVFTIMEDAPFEDARHIFRARRVRHLPVTSSEGRVVGLLSIRHLFDMLFEM